MEYSKPNPGETIFCWKPGQNYVSHKHILCLDKNNVLVPHPQKGWDVISLEELPVGFYRGIGTINLIEAKVSEAGFTKIVYAFYDKQECTEITAVKVRDSWKIFKNFEMPSWVGGKDARGTGSKEDCGSNVEGSGGENLNSDSSSERSIS
jgi:hypothetical protein